jgi:hypothetical protein
MNSFESCQQHANGHFPFCVTCENEVLRNNLRSATEQEKQAEERIEKLITRLDEAMGPKE